MNVRWDAVGVDSRFWAEPPRPAAVRFPANQEETRLVSAKVWLYGTLASVLEKRPLELQVPQGYSVTDILAELSRRYGDAFSERVMGTDGRKLKQCRVFVDGLLADDEHRPMYMGSSPALVEIILLTAIEGG